MHSQERLELLLDNPIAQELIEILENEGKCVLEHLDFSFIDEVFEQQKATDRGRPWIYAPSLKLKAFLYGFSEGKVSIHGVARSIQTSVAQVFLGLPQGGMSYATLERFWHQFADIAEKVFRMLVRLIASLGILGTTQAVDSTSIATPYRDDPDAVWSYDATKKQYYFGYGLLLVVDVGTQLPIAARFVQRKQASTKGWMTVIRDAGRMKKPLVLLGDSGLDIVELQEQLMDDGVLPVIPYNARNADEPLAIKYRVEDLVHRRSDKVSFNRRMLDSAYAQRNAVENANNVLKQMGLEDIRVRGWDAVKAQVYFVLVLRLAIAIARFFEDHTCNLRRISIGG